MRKKSGQTIKDVIRCPNCLNEMNEDICMLCLNNIKELMDVLEDEVNIPIKDDDETGENLNLDQDVEDGGVTDNGISDILGNNANEEINFDDYNDFDYDDYDDEDLELKNIEDCEHFCEDCEKSGFDCEHYEGCGCFFGTCPYCHYKCGKCFAVEARSFQCETCEQEKSIEELYSFGKCTDCAKKLGDLTIVEMTQEEKLERAL